MAETPFFRGLRERWLETMRNNYQGQGKNKTKNKKQTAGQAVIRVPACATDAALAYPPGQAGTGAAQSG